MEFKLLQLKETPNYKHVSGLRDWEVLHGFLMVRGETVSLYPVGNLHGEGLLKILQLGVCVDWFKE